MNRSPCKCSSFCKRECTQKHWNSIDFSHRQQAVQVAVEVIFDCAIQLRTRNSPFVIFIRINIQRFDGFARPFFFLLSCFFRCCFSLVFGSLENFMIRHKFVEIFFAFQIILDGTGKEREIIDERRKDQRKRRTCDKRESLAWRNSHCEGLCWEYRRSIDELFLVSTSDDSLQSNNKRTDGWCLNAASSSPLWRSASI